MKVELDLHEEQLAPGKFQWLKGMDRSYLMFSK